MIESSGRRLNPLQLVLAYDLFPIDWLFLGMAEENVSLENVGVDRLLSRHQNVSTGGSFDLVDMIVVDWQAKSYRW